MADETKQWPNNVGIIAMELIFPSQYVDQVELEKYDNVSAGKYTIGLGQSKMGFCTDCEDINSLCLTVVHKLLEKYSINPNRIGRLEVGTETIIDKSKSVKSVLMQLFEPYGCTDIEGVDTTNACYGGTAALFNALAWIESSAWDGRLALAVAGDIAVYAKGSARPTGGAGAIAMLVGPNAALVIDRGLRATYMKHAYDFYKPDLSSEYPTVDGRLSVQCYLSALDHCYQLWCQKATKKMGTVDMNTFDAFIFHSPYCKLVQKSVARLLLNDYVRSPSKFPDDLKHLKQIKLDQTYFDRDIEKEFLKLSAGIFEMKTKPSLMLANQVGNMYTPSVYAGLVSFLLSKPLNQLVDNRIVLFSYGSGLASSMYSLTVCNNDKLAPLLANLNEIKHLLDERICVAPEQFTKILEIREMFNHAAPYQPQFGVEHLFPGTYYLKSVDEMHRRSYERLSIKKKSVSNGTS